MIPILHSSAVITPGQLGPTSTELDIPGCFVDADHVDDRNAFGNSDDDRDSGIDRLENCVGGKRGGTKIMVALAPVSLNRFVNGIKHGQVGDGLATFAGVTPPTILVPYRKTPAGVKFTDAAGDSLANDFGVFVDEDAHDFRFQFSVFSY